MDKNWTDKLPELLEEYQETAPEGLWDAVQAGMAPARRRVAPVWWITAAGLLAAASIAIAVFLRPDVVESPVSVVPGGPLADVSALPVPPVSPVPPVIPDTPPVIPDSIGDLPREQSTPVPHPEDTVVPAQEPEAPVAPGPPATPGPPIVPDTPPVIPDSSSVIPGSIGDPPRRRAAPSVSLTVSCGGFPGQQATGTTSGYGLFAHPGLAAADVPSKSNILWTAATNRESTTASAHTQSARLSIGVLVGLGDRWGISSGVGYTTLNSRFESAAGSTRAMTERRTSYVGVPLFAQYTLPEWHRFSVYFYAGPMYEIAISSKTEVSYCSGETLLSSDSKTDPVRDNRWSANAGAGLQLRLFRRSLIFVQSGFSWHFPNGGRLENFYTEHPAAFDLSFGYRVNLREGR